MPQIENSDDLRFIANHPFFLRTKSSRGLAFTGDNYCRVQKFFQKTLNNYGFPYFPRVSFEIFLMKKYAMIVSTMTKIPRYAHILSKCSAVAS